MRTITIDRWSLTVDEYWDCECEENYTHAKQEQPECRKCGCKHEEVSDSRIDAVSDFLRKRILEAGASEEDLNELLELERQATLIEEQPNG